MADSFIPLSNTNPADQTCPAGQGYSLTFQRCLSKQDYLDAVRAMLAAGHPQQAADLIKEGKANGVIGETSIINAILEGNTQAIGQMALPFGIALVGLILVVLAISAWVNTKSITIAGQSIPLPKVL